MRRARFAAFVYGERVAQAKGALAEHVQTVMYLQPLPRGDCASSRDPVTSCAPWGSASQG